MNRFIAELELHAWAVEPRALNALVAILSGPSADAGDVVADAHAAMAARADGKRPQLVVDEGVAVIPIKGYIMADVPWFFGWFGIEATSTRVTRELVAEAVADDRIESILLDVDSPGGSIDGLAELANDIAAATNTKSVTAQTGSMMASAAYWIGAQADTIDAGPTSAVGSIGVYTVIHDSSKAAEDAGVKVHVISSHELKGAGVPGSEVTKAQLGDWQRNVNTYTDLFVEAVAAGRGIDNKAATALATGQVWIGQEAVDKGLVDSIRAASAETSDAPVATPTAPEGAKENSMTELEKTQAAELAEARAANEKLVAKNEAFEASLVAVKTQGMASVIAANRDRVTPGMLASVERFAATCDDQAELEAFIATLPVQTRADGIGLNTPPPDASKDSIAMTPAQIQLEEHLGLTEETHRFDDVVSMTSDGKCKLTNGKTVTAASLTAAPQLH